MDQSMQLAVYAILISFTASVILCPILIPYLIKLKFGQTIRSDGPQTHLKKTGTPTMGGIAIVLSLIASSAFFVWGNYDACAVVLVTIGYAIIGFTDDYIKVVKKRSLGLKALPKMIGQIIITVFFALYIYYRADASTAIYIPFTDGFYFDLGIFYYFFLFVVMVGSVNGVNLTDGLDGLAAGVTVLVSTFFIFMAYALQSDVLPIVGAAVGALLGFLLFNSHPAKVIMGDTGSLALGGFVASVAILLKLPLVLVIVGIIYVVETLSVMIQVSYFKMTKGKRIFKMAPIHHHFELSGMSETKIVSLFYITTAVACLIGFLVTNV